MRTPLAACGLTALAFLTSWTPVEAQRYPLAPRVTGGETMHPFFEGFYLNPDGSRTLSFGYFNRNLGDNPVYIPLGEDNFIEPAEFDGSQPEWFPIRRERGVFSITVPPDWLIDQTVTWSFRSGEEMFSVPSTFHEAYELKFPMAMGSSPPFFRMEPDGEESFGIQDPLWGEPRTATVGEPLEFTFWARDHLEPEGPREEVAVRVTMWTHRGPELATIVAEQPPEDEEEEPDGSGGGRFREPPLPNSAEIPLDSDDGAANFTVTFDDPGEYLLRVMVDNHAAVDSGQGDQCCWSNGFVEVSVSP